MTRFHSRKLMALSSLSMARLSALVVLSLTCACSALDNCPDAQADIVIDRPDAADTEALFYQSAPFDGPLDPFPAKTQLIFKHHLGVVPGLPKVYLSFTKEGTRGADDGSVTEAAGNEAPFECMDSNVVVVKNDTCERSFFISLIVYGSPNGKTDDHSCGDYASP